MLDIYPLYGEMTSKNEDAERKLISWPGKSDTESPMHCQGGSHYVCDPSVKARPADEM